MKYYFVGACIGLTILNIVLTFKYKTWINVVLLLNYIAIIPYFYTYKAKKLKINKKNKSNNKMNYINILKEEKSKKIIVTALTLASSITLYIMRYNIRINIISIIFALIVLLYTWFNKIKLARITTIIYTISSIFLFFDGFNIPLTIMNILNIIIIMTLCLIKIVDNKNNIDETTTTDKYEELLEMGIISKEEYDEIKNK